MRLTLPINSKADKSSRRAVAFSKLVSRAEFLSRRQQSSVRAGKLP